MTYLIVRWAYCRRAANFLGHLKVKFAELPEGELRKRVFYALGV